MARRRDFVPPPPPEPPRKDVGKPLKTPAYEGADRAIHDNTSGPLTASRSKRGLPGPGDERPIKPYKGMELPDFGKFKPKPYMSKPRTPKPSDRRIGGAGKYRTISSRGR